MELVFKANINTTRSPTLRPPESNPAAVITVHWSNSVVQDNRVSDARVMFRVCRRIHPKFDYHMGAFVAQIESWEGGICTVVIDAAVFNKCAAAVEAPSGRGELRFAVPTLRLYSGWQMRDVVEVDPEVIVSYEGVRGDHLKT